MMNHEVNMMNKLYNCLSARLKEHNQDVALELELEFQLLEERFNDYCQELLAKLGCPHE